MNFDEFTSLQGVKATNFQDLVAKVKNLVALAPVLGAISRPALDSHFYM